MNLKFNFDYPEDGAVPKKEWTWLYEVADNDLMLFLAYVAKDHPNTKFLVYSRGTGGKWTEEADRKEWVRRARERFPELRKAEITTMLVRGGVKAGNFSTKANADDMRKNVEDILGLEKKATDRPPSQK
jgi:hypothetical protein